MPRYNGHRNWDYWNVSLWINNDERLYRQALGCVRHTRTKTEAAQWMLNELNHAGITETRDGALYTLNRIRAAMVEM
jgi:hypothetical protein